MPRFLFVLWRGIFITVALREMQISLLSVETGTSSNYQNLNQVVEEKC